MSSDGSDDSLTCTPPEVRQLAETVSSQLLPEKSRARYEAQFNAFIMWCEEKGVKNYSENDLLAYFTDLVGKNKKSLWAIFSMLKSCIMLNKNVDISKYAKLTTYIKRQTEHYKPKKSLILDEENIGAFLTQAPDINFLLMKVVLIIGVSGALRREEMCNMLMKDVQLKDDIIIITIPKTKTNISRSFVITKEQWVATIQKYLQIRLTITKVPDRFFLKYQNGKCCVVPIGINNFGSIPSKIATFLKLPNPRQYTGHCFRRSAATLLANRGGDLLTLKRFGGWKSGTVAEGYVADSLKRQIDVAHMMTEAGPSAAKRPTSEINPCSSKIPAENSSVEIEHIEHHVGAVHEHTTTTTEVKQLMPGLFSDVQNCTINVNIYNSCNINK